MPPAARKGRETAPLSTGYRRYPVSGKAPRHPCSTPPAGRSRAVPLGRAWDSFFRDRRGVVVIMFALMLPILVGFVALGVEMTFWFMLHRDLQSAADAAAIGASYSVKSNGSTSEVDAAALQEAVRNGLDISDGDTITVNKPPTSGSFTSNAYAVEVVLSRPVALLFSGVFLDNAISIDTRAVATLTSETEACVLALDTSASGTLTNQGNADISMTGCAIAVNSSNSSALSITGSSTLTTDCVYVVGDYSVGSNATLTTECPSAQSGALAVEDPYEDVPEPTIGGCLQTNYSISSGTLPQGTYCRGVNFSGTVALETGGVYVIDRGSFKVNAGATLTGTNVTIFLTSSTGSQYASATINGGAIVTLSANDSGDYAGLLFYQDDDTPSIPTSNHTFNGGATMQLTGALYFPNGNINYTGGAALGGSCTQLIAQTITFGGDADMNIACSDSGISSIDILDTVGLVE